MEVTGQIEIRISGKEGNNLLTPENYDIREIQSMLESIENLLYPAGKKGRPIISYKIEKGSVRNIFTTSKQVVVQFAAVAAMVTSSGSIDALELPTALALENIQKQAWAKDYSFEIMTSETENVVLRITPQTKYERNTQLWVDAEFYFYGSLVNAGGKSRANIHLDTKEAGLLTIDASKEFLSTQETNLLYKKFGVRVKGRQHITSGEIDKSNLELLELIDYSPRYDENYLNKLITQATPKLMQLGEDWLSQLRGGSLYE